MVLACCSLTRGETYHSYCTFLFSQLLPISPHSQHTSPALSTHSPRSVPWPPLFPTPDTPLSRPLLGGTLHFSRCTVITDNLQSLYCSPHLPASASKAESLWFLSSHRLSLSQSEPLLPRTVDRPGPIAPVTSVGEGPSCSSVNLL